MDTRQKITIRFPEGSTMKQAIQQVMLLVNTSRVEAGMPALTLNDLCLMALRREVERQLRAMKKRYHGHGRSDVVAYAEALLEQAP